MRMTVSIGAMFVLGTACGGTTQNPGVMGVAQLNDLSVMFPLAHDQDEFDSYLTPASAGSTGSLVPETLFNAADTAGIRYSDLRLVSFRLDPCFAQIGPIADPSMCDVQLRLIFQTLTFQNGASADDNAVHAFYRLDLSQFQAMLSAIITLREASGGTAELGGLAPHPIIAQQGLTGELATQLRATVLQYAGAANLIRFTLFRSAALDSPSPPGASGESRFWNFHGFDITSGATTPMVIPTLPNAVSDVNFPSTATQPLYGKFQPETTAADNMQILASYPSAMQASASDRQSAYDAALRIENPNFNSPNTIDCASCHTSQPARQLIGEKYFGLSAQGNANAFHADPRIPAADVVSTTPVLDGDVLNLHAFSYRATAPMINQRVINETAATLAYVNAGMRSTP